MAGAAIDALGAGATGGVVVAVGGAIGETCGTFAGTSFPPHANATAPQRNTKAARFMAPFYHPGALFQNLRAEIFFVGDENGAGRRAHDAPASPTRDESLQLTFLALSDDQKICAAITCETNQLEIRATDHDMTSCARNQLTQHRLTNFFHALELTTYVEMDRRLGILWDARDVNGVHANIRMFLRDRFRQRERITRRLRKIDADGDHEFMPMS